MDQINLNRLLDREKSIQKMKDLLIDFDINKNNPLFKKGIYVYGESGSGKTSFVMDVLKEMDYDVIRYDAGDIRNKTIVDTIASHNMSDKNIMSMFHKKVKKIVIVMDEIDGMNNGDKGGINTLIKLIRPKKTKKQKQEENAYNPIICIGNYHIDKKIKELMKVCNTIELKTPNSTQMTNIIYQLIPALDPILCNNIINYVQSDLRKLKTIHNIYLNKKSILQNEIMQNIFQLKSYNDDAKKITQKLINSNYHIDAHNTFMNETDRTIVGLLWHENIIDCLNKMDSELSIPIYLKLLDNICFADYIDRVTFQKQIWQFNEMSSLIKTFQNNNIYHSELKKKIKFNPTEVRFTKVLTKYSTEYNNSLFIQHFCQQLGMDKKDLFSFFLDLRNKHDDNEILLLFENYEITKLDINRIYRYIEKYTKDIEIEEDTDVEVEL
jgi:ATPase family associated with various cellular activities (AAA)